MKLQHVDEQFKQRFWYSTVAVLAVILGIYIFLQSAPYVLVIVMGLVLASVMSNLIKFLCTKTNISYKPMFIVTWLLVVGMPIGLLYISAPELGTQLSELQENVQQLGDPRTNLPDWIPARSYVESEVAAFDLRSFLTTTVVSGQLGNLAFTVGSIITGVVVLLFIAIYASLHPSLYTRTALSFITKAKRSYAEQKLAIMSLALSAWIKARLFSMGAVAVLTFIGLLILGVEQALFLALIAGLFSFVPNIGPIISLLPAALVAVLQSPLLLLYVIILYVLVQAIESYFISPFVEQRLVTTPPAILIATQVIFGVLFGIMGIILAAPLLAVIFALQGAKSLDRVS